jgi:hypothetical protein
MLARTNRAVIAAVLLLGVASTAALPAADAAAAHLALRAGSYCKYSQSKDTLPKSISYTLQRSDGFSPDCPAHRRNIAAACSISESGVQCLAGSGVSVSVAYTVPAGTDVNCGSGALGGAPGCSKGCKFLDSVHLFPPSVIGAFASFTLLFYLLSSLCFRLTHAASIPCRIRASDTSPSQPC